MTRFLRPKAVLPLSVLITLAASLTAGASSCEGGYTDVVQKRVKEALGEDLKSYQFFSYPTDNFGVATSYRLRNKTDKPDDNTFLCATDRCLGLAEGPASKDLKKFVSDGKGGSIQLKEDEQRAVAASIVMPAIKNLVGASATLDSKKKTTLELQIGRAVKRKLERDPFIKYANSTTSNDELKKAFNKGELAVVVGDVVVETLLVSLCVDSTVDGKLDAALKGKVGQVVGGDNGIKLAVSESSKGCYALSATAPVVVAVLTKRQPAKGELQGGAGDLFGWDPAPAAVLKKAPKWWTKRKV